MPSADFVCFAVLWIASEAVAWIAERWWALAIAGALIVAALATVAV